MHSVEVVYLCAIRRARNLMTYYIVYPGGSQMRDLSSSEWKEDAYV